MPPLYEVICDAAAFVVKEAAAGSQRVDAMRALVAVFAACLIAILIMARLHHHPAPSHPVLAVTRDEVPLLRDERRASNSCWEDLTDC